MECGSLSQAQFAQRDARQHCYGKGSIVVLGDLANRQSGTEAEQAVGRSALRMLHSVGRVPMVPEREFVWRSQSSNCVRIGALSFCLSFCLTYSFTTPTPSSLSSVLGWRIFMGHVCMRLSVCTCMSMHHMYLCVYGAFFRVHKCQICATVLAQCVLVHACMYWSVCACVSQTSVNGKFPHGLLHSHLNALFLFSIPLCHPPVHLLSCLTLVFVSSRERIENTTCHKLFRGLSLFLHGSMFIIP